jgi:ATP phosphoribosyltransferase regulatory subunit
MVYQPPVGARDLLPLDVVQKRWIEERLQQVFHQWGYHRIITSTLERLDTLMAGGAIDRATVIQVQDMEEEALGLRPELTASIARAVVTRMAGAAFPLRLYYNANVFRRAQEGSYNRQQEFYQAGVELLGVGGVAADAEILLLLVDCLNNLQLDRCHLILGEAELTRSLLSVFPAPLQSRLRTAIAHLDRIALEQLPLSPELRDRALLLLDLRGRPADVLQRVSGLDLTPEQKAIVHTLKSLVDLLQDSYSGPGGTVGSALSLILDLSLIRTFDYYTGIVFEVVSEHPSGLQILGQGGRYDQLLGLYHPQEQSHPGVGFSLQIEPLHQALSLTGRLPQQTHTSDWLVVPADARAYTLAFAHAQKLRQTDPNVRVELDLQGRSADASRADARHRRIAQVAWIQADGTVTTELLN